MTLADRFQTLGLPAGGQCGALMRTIDWGSGPVGSPDGWPPSLRTALGIMLDSAHPMAVVWGAERVLFYNDGYRPMLGQTKHPSAMGRPTRVTFPEIWEQIAPLFDRIWAHEAPLLMTDQLFVLERNGYAEECYFDFSYGAIRDERGRVGGVFVACTETTRRVLSARRLGTLRDLATRTADARTAEEVGAAVARVLADHRADVPFALLYVLEDEGAAVRLLGASGATPHVPNGATPSDVRAVAAPWPPGERIDDEPVWETVDLAALLPDLPGGSFLESTARALPLRIRVSAPGASDAVLVAGVSPRRELDDDYLWGLKTRSHSGASPEGCDRHGASPRCLDRPHQDLWEIGCGKSVG